MPAPDLPAVRAYLGDDAPPDTEIANALNAESAAQAAVCRVPGPTVTWPEDLAEALKRRVARNLYMKGLPSGLQSAMSEMAVSTVRVGSDPEIRRLEAPHRRVSVG